MLRISRPLEYADRFGRQQADQAIKKNAVRALVELITNSDDSYNRLEEKGHAVTGKIIVAVLRRRDNSEIWVTDLAEGMDESALDKGMGKYAEELSGFSIGAPVRGYFGRGLKDAILGLGRGEIHSIKDNQLHIARLFIKDAKAHYEAENPQQITSLERSKFGIPTGNGTAIHLTVSRGDVSMPQFDTIRRQLSFYFSLRNILTNSKRRLLLSEVDDKRKVHSELQLSYKTPKGLQLLSDIKRDLNYHNKPLTAQFVLFRSEIPLNTPGEEGPIAQGGLLVCGKNAIYDNTLLKFEGSEAARRFLGRIICPHLDELLKADEPIVKATRDGLDWEHEFNKALKREIETFLEPFIRQEEQRSREKETKARSAKLQRKLDNALSELNRIAKLELEVEPGRGPKPPKEPLVPESGLGFIPEFSQIISGKEGTLLLRALSDLIAPDTFARISSDNPEIKVLTPEVILAEREGFSWLVEAKARLEGGQVNNQGVIIGDLDTFRTEALVEVIARRKDPNGPPPPPPGGLFQEVKFDPSPDPPLRVRFDRHTHNIVIYTSAASVNPYVTPHLIVPEIDDTPQGQVLLAELVLEASCSEIIRRNVASGRIPLPQGTEVEALENAYRGFRQKYASRIHEIFVDKEYRH